MLWRLHWWSGINFFCFNKLTVNKMNFVFFFIIFRARIVDKTNNHWYTNTILRASLATYGGGGGIEFRNIWSKNFPEFKCVWTTECYGKRIKLEKKFLEILHFFQTKKTRISEFLLLKIPNQCTHRICPEFSLLLLLNMEQIFFFSFKNNNIWIL